jgi:hypothetical protein
MTRINRDRLANAPSKAISATAVRLAATLQDAPKEHQLLAVAALFRVMCEEFRVEGPDVLTMASNVTATTLYKPNVAFEGLRLYVRNELVKGA